MQNRFLDKRLQLRRNICLLLIGFEFLDWSTNLFDNFFKFNF